MATFSLYTSSSLILLLLSLTTGDLLLRTDAAALNDVCSQTKEQARCITLLKSSDTRSPTAALPELGQIAIVAATDSAGDVKIKVHNLGLSERDPKLKSVYLACEDLYFKALDQLLIAPEYLQKREYNKLLAVAGVVRNSVSGCASAVQNNGGLRQGNIDTGVLADAIAVVAKKLS
ncbi:hypothetical protein C2S53_009231 [Perilla frutescens var. hirtella]|uniref:Pectinesterase inhibitor domain-containing protein n=1 Tax=Perilla frutescens var. hirtella TaxID=608512 RepID=A0AAD4IQ15_PERFH|nr:hypothetical protein C2S53_009231 [Perilla frutescens var. hirtella]